MALEVRPFGVKCNIACQYCYQHPERDAGNEARSYDMDKILGTLEEEKSSFTLFGGEPLLMPTEDLQALWADGLGKHGCVTRPPNLTQRQVPAPRRPTRPKPAK